MPGRSRFESSPVGVGEPDVEELCLSLRTDDQLVRELFDHVTDAGHRGVDDERLAAALAERPDAQHQRAVARVERHVDLVVDAVGGSARGDQVGDQHGVVEPVERKVGAGGEHADDAAQDRAHERARGDGDRCGALLAGHATPSRGPHENDIRSRLPRIGASWTSTESARAAISGSPRPGPSTSGLGPMPRPRSATITSSCSPLGLTTTSIGPGSSPAYAWRTTLLHASVTASRMSATTSGGSCSASAKAPSTWRITAMFSGRAGSVSRTSDVTAATWALRRKRCDSRPPPRRLWEVMSLPIGT